jgi:Cobalamin-independent synthase, Catalytic domain
MTTPKFRAGEITDGELRAVEDAAITAAVRSQEDAGIDVVTDGEFRRRDFRTGFVDATAVAALLGETPFPGSASTTRRRRPRGSPSS